MAGNYMDAPAHRVAYDRDGSVFVTVTSAGSVTTLPQSYPRYYNGELDAVLSFPSSAARFAVLFSVPQDVAGVFIAASGSLSSANIETSRDTTTGLDGTWDAHSLHAVVPSRQTKPNYRMSSYLNRFVAGEISRSVRAVRVSSNPLVNLNTNVLATLHIYANVSSTATTDRLALWHPTLDQPLAPTWFDWGDVPRSSSADRTFRIKNLSSTLTAHSTDVAMEALTPANPSLVGMHLFSSASGGGFVPSLNIPSLAPGALSPVFTVRRTVPANAEISTWSARITADVTSWTE